MVAQHRGKEVALTQFVSETQAEEILEELRPWPHNRPPIHQFRDQLEATVETIWAIHRIVGLYRPVSIALGKLGRSGQEAKTVLLAMEESGASPELENYRDLLKLCDVRATRLAIDQLEQNRSQIPATFSGQQKPQKGPAPRAWYSGFVRDLAEIAEEDLSIDVTTGGDWSKNPHETPFTVFVFAVESLLPPGDHSDSLAVCARRIDRAIAASEDEIDQPIARKGEQRKPAFSRLIAASSINSAHAWVIRNFLANSLASRRYHCARQLPPLSQDLKLCLVGLPSLPGVWGD
jgi:hypothetical protein